MRLARTFKHQEGLKPMRHLRVLSGAAAICAAFFVQSSSQAGFGHFGGMGSMGGYGSAGLGYGSYGSSGYDAGYGSSGGIAVAAYGSSGGGSAGFGSGGGVGHVGPLKRFAGRIHARHAAKAAARSSFYGGSGGSSGGGYGSTGMSHGSSGGYGSSGSTAVYGGGSSGGAMYSGGSVGSSYAAPMYDSSYAPADMYTPMTNEPMMDGGYDSGSVVEPAPATPTPTPTPDAEASLEKDAALLTIAVPESATVVVNGLETTSVGEIRQFMSNGLKEGYVYTYVVAVSYADTTEPETRTIKLRAGQAERLVFDAPKISKAKPSALETVVVLRVPADAKVNLAGNPTNGSGELRTFRTRQLGEGQTWENYTIEVTADINGQPVTKEKTLSLVAGTSHDFSFDFGNTSIASR